MTPLELFIVVSAMLGLAIFRFGVPLLLMWAFKQLYHRVLHVPAA